MAVRRAFTRLARVSELQANPRNPNKHPAPQIELYAKILKHQGIRRPAVVSKESGLIVTGHGLVETLRFLAVRDCPIDEQSFRGSKPGDPGPDELAHLLADNSLPQLADLDAAQVTALEQELSLAGLDLQLTGKLLEEKEDPALTAEYPITAKMLEQHDFVVIVCDNATDFVFLQSLVGARSEKSYKKTGVGTGRVIPFRRFLQTIRENRHSLDVQGAHNDDAKARA